MAHLSLEIIFSLIVKDTILANLPLEVIPPLAGEMSAQPTKGTRLREKKVLSEAKRMRWKSKQLLAAGAGPLCVKGAVATLVATGGLLPSNGRRLSARFCYNPSVTASRCATSLCTREALAHH